MSKIRDERGGKGDDYLLGGDFQALPVDAREDVLDEGRVEGELGLLELGVAEVERVGEGRRLAGFDGAGEEVDG